MLLKDWNMLEYLSLGPVSMILAAVCATFAIVFLYQVLFDPLRDVPGPVAAKFTRLWELRAVRKSDFPSTHAKLHEEYGPVVRIAPNRFSIKDAQAFKAIYGHGSRFTKAQFYHPFGHPNPDLADLFSERDPQRHAAKRRMVASLYSMTALLSYERFVDKCNAELCEKLRIFAAERRLINIPQWMQYYAFDVIGEITVGKSFGYMEKETDPRGILSAIDESMVYGSRIGLLPELHPWLALLATTFNMKIPFDRVADFINEQIHDRKSGKVAGIKDDFLDKLLALQANGKIDDHNFFTTVGANIAAGSDTTAITLSAIIYSLLKNPSAATKLRQEIEEFSRAGKISDPVTFQEAQKMPYLQAVIKESLRIHPATGQMLARVVPDGGAVLTGRFFPAGSVVGSSPWVTHLDEEIYGAEPNQFRPERWLENEQKAATMDTNLFSFGAGSRTCIGRNISMLEVTKVIPQIFRNFDLQFEQPTDTWTLDSGWFVKQRFFCWVKLRSNGGKETYSL